MLFFIILKGTLSNHFRLGWEMKGGGFTLKTKLSAVNLSSQLFQPGLPLVRNWLELHISFQQFSICSSHPSIKANKQIHTNKQKLHDASSLIFTPLLKDTLRLHGRHHTSASFLLEDASRTHYC